MTYQWPLPAFKQPTVTILLDRTQIESPFFSERLAALDHHSRAIVLDWRKEQITVVCKGGDNPATVFALAAEWGWVCEAYRHN